MGAYAVSHRLVRAFPHVPSNAPEGRQVLRHFAALRSQRPLPAFVFLRESPRPPAPLGLVAGTLLLSPPGIRPSYSAATFFEGATSAVIDLVWRIFRSAIRVFIAAEVEIASCLKEAISDRVN